MTELSSPQTHHSTCTDRYGYPWDDSCQIQAGEVAGGNGQPASHDSRADRYLPGTRDDIVGAVEAFLIDYVVLPPEQVLVTALWVLASWLADRWDQFP
ncbi:MAG: hypothetical protein WCK89_24140, partial [bacterium]